MKHNRIKELWINRPWVYIPAVIRFMRKYPLTKDGKFKIWIRNCFYLNWQVCFKRKAADNK
jgi:hypothetical protein